MKIYHCSICSRITASLIETLTTKPMCPDCWELYQRFNENGIMPPSIYDEFEELCHKPLSDCQTCDKCEGREEK